MSVEAIKRIMAYLVGTITKRLTAVRNGATEWMMYSDSDHAGDRVVNGSRSVTGVMFVCNGMPIHWRSNTQPVSSSPRGNTQGAQNTFLGPVALLSRLAKLLRGGKVLV